MTKHFPTVPVDGALRAAHTFSPNRLRPLALVADDDPMITATLAEILNVSGLAALTAEDGVTALETAHLIPPEILIADLLMPGMSGLDLAIHVTRATPDCEVILFAGNAAIAGLQATMRSLGCHFRILFKPVHPADLLQAVFELLVPRGHALSFPRQTRRPSHYDLLTSVRPEPDPMPIGCNVSRRQQAGAGFVH